MEVAEPRNIIIYEINKGVVPQNYLNDSNVVHSSCCLFKRKSSVEKVSKSRRLTRVQDETIKTNKIIQGKVPEK